MAFVASKIFLTKGVGKHRERLSSFELALRNAGIAACNIVRVSSIFPPSCKLISRSEGLKHLKPGQVAFTVISENQTREPHRLIAAGVGLALPADKSMYGYLSEHHSFGESEEIAGEYAEELAAEMLIPQSGRRMEYVLKGMQSLASMAIEGCISSVGAWGGIGRPLLLAGSPWG